MMIEFEIEDLRWEIESKRNQISTLSKNYWQKAMLNLARERESKQLREMQRRMMDLRDIAADPKRRRSLARKWSRPKNLLIGGHALPHDWHETLTGLEYVDQQLSRSDLSKVEGTPIGIIDIWEDGHGPRTGRIFAPLTERPHREIRYVGSRPGSKSTGLVDGLKQFLETSPPPAVINVSLGAYEIPRSLTFAHANRGTVIVIAGGNRLSTDPDGESSFSLQKGKAGDYMIVVGGSTSTGLESDTQLTHPGPHIHVIAPSYPIPTHHSLRPASSNATSAAAPQVARAIANTKAILPELRIDSIRHLIERTNQRAIRYFHKGTSTKGPGVLNAFKLWKVAKRLEQLPPDQREAAIKSEDLYNFSAESAELIRKAGQTENPKRVFKLLHQAFLLNPQPATAQLILSNLRSWPFRYPLIEVAFEKYFDRPGELDIHFIRLMKARPDLRAHILGGILRQWEQGQTEAEDALKTMIDLEIPSRDRETLIEILEDFIAKKPTQYLRDQAIALIKNHRP